MFNTQLPWHLKSNRYAVLGVPRSGTQLLEAFVNYSLSKQYDDVVSLQEIFALAACAVNTLKIEDGKAKLYDYSDVRFQDISVVTSQRLELLKQADSNQAMTSRVFLDDRMSSHSLADGIKYLQDLNFSFVYINRSMEHKIISAIFARRSWIYNRIKNPNTLHIDIPDLKTRLIGLHMIEQQNKKVLDATTAYDTVEYNSIVSMTADLDDHERQLAYGIFKEKQLPTDPYEQISNADEVKEVFTDFYPKLLELTTQLL